VLHSCALFGIKALPNTTDTKHGSAWTRDELVLALYLYCQIPFAKTKASSSEIIQLAQTLGRTPSSVARQLGNFGAFDPLLAQKGITGLIHYSNADKEIWNDFYQHRDLLVEASQAIIAKGGFSTQLAPEPEEETQSSLPALAFPTGPTAQPKLVMTRLYQSFFRRAVLSSYGSTCCVCGIDFPQLLVASHIKPWGSSEETRTGPENGLCLCVLHDKAYDRGLMTVNAKYEVSVSSSIANSKVAFVGISLAAFDKQKIKMPSRFAPKPEYLDWHRKNIFKA